MSKRGFWLTMLGVLILLVLIIGGEKLFDTSANALSSPGQPSESTEVLFAGSFYSFVEEAPEIFDDLGLYAPDAFVFGGDALWSNTEENERAFEAAVAAAEGIADTVIVTRGNHDGAARVFDDREASGSVMVGDVQIISLDTTVLGSGDESCGIDEAQMVMLREALDKSAEHRIVVTHHALWAHDGYVDTVRPNAPNVCAGSFWEDEVLPLLRGRVDVVISGDGGAPTPFAIVERDDIRYVLSGSPIHERVSGGENAGAPTRAVFVRLSASDEGVTVAPVTLAAPALIDTRSLDDIPTFNAVVDESELSGVYQSLPFYEVGTDWQMMIEPNDIMEQIRAPIQAVVTVGGAASFPAELSVRGNVGNHWGPYKKSWDIEASSGEGRQIKLIKPSDRGYVSQMYVQIMSEWLGVPTPKISPARLIINDHDMGVYLVYEDFDKAFIELNGFGSDTAPSRNYFRDHFWNPNVLHSLPSIGVPGKSQDRTHQQQIDLGSTDPSAVVDRFERDIFARWLALQIFINDQHQHEWDNFRFFNDRSTGRFVMVTWDASIEVVDGNVNIVSQTGKAFYEDPDNRELTDNYVRDLVEQAPAFRAQFVDLGAALLPVFQADATLEASQAQIAAGLERVLERFDANVEKLEDY